MMIIAIILMGMTIAANIIFPVIHAIYGNKKQPVYKLLLFVTAAFNIVFAVSTVFLRPAFIFNETMIALLVSPVIETFLRSTEFLFAISYWAIIGMKPFFFLIKFIFLWNRYDQIKSIKIAVLLIFVMLLIPIVGAAPWFLMALYLWNPKPELTESIRSTVHLNFDSSIEEFNYIGIIGTDGIKTSISLAVMILILMFPFVLNFTLASQLYSNHHNTNASPLSNRYKKSFCIAGVFESAVSLFFMYGPLTLEMMLILLSDGIIGFGAYLIRAILSVPVAETFVYYVIVQKTFKYTVNPIEQPKPAFVIIIHGRQVLMGPNDAQFPSHMISMNNL